MYSKYERRMDTRTYEDRKTLYDGGWEVVQNTLNTLNTLFLGGGAGLHGRAVVDREVRRVGKEACPSSAEVAVVKESYSLQN